MTSQIYFRFVASGLKKYRMDDLLTWIQIAPLYSTGAVDGVKRLSEARKKTVLILIH